MSMTHLARDLISSTRAICDSSVSGIASSTSLCADPSAELPFSMAREAHCPVVLAGCDLDASV